MPDLPSQCWGCCDSTELSSVKTLGTVIVYECSSISLSVEIILPKYLCKTEFQYTE